MSTKRRKGNDAGDFQRRQILQFVQKFVRQEGYSPSYREIGEELRLAVSTVSYHVSILKLEGLLSREDGQPRTIVNPVGPASRAEGDQVEVPIIGQIAAGDPIDAERSFEETIVVSRRLVGYGKLFALKVKGDSMIGAAIADGDLVVIRQQEVAENGEIVAAQLDRDGVAEATVKTLQRVDGHIWLMPANLAYQPIPADDARILGKLVGVIRGTQA